MTHGKFGGIHYLTIGKLRIQWCWVRKAKPKSILHPQLDLFKRNSSTHARKVQVLS